MPVSAGIVAQLRARRDDRARSSTQRRSRSTTGSRSTLDFLGEDTLDVEQAEATVAAYVDCCGSSPTRGLTRQRRGVGQAQRDRPGAARQRPQDRPRERPHDLPGRRATPAPRSPSTWRTTPPPTRRWRSCASCARTSPRPAPCSRPTCTAPRPTAARWPTRAPGSGCARAPTTSPRRSPSRTTLDVDKSYVRCLKVLLAGQGYPMIATHDPRLIEIASSLRQPLRPRARAPTSSRCSTASAPRSRGGWSQAGETGARLHPLRRRSGTAT